MKCPTCHQSWDVPHLPIEQLPELFPKAYTKRALLDVLARAKGRWVKKGFIEESVWGDEAYDRSVNLFSVMLHQVRPVLCEYGWEIECAWANRTVGAHYEDSRYRLIPRRGTRSVPPLAAHTE